MTTPKKLKEIKKNMPKPIKEEILAGALPEYKIRTMKDDLAQLGLKELEKEAKEVEKIKAPPSPPEELPIAPEIKPKIKKAPLPSTEELITEKPEKIPSAPLPPKPVAPQPPEVKPTLLIKEKKKPKVLIILIIIIIVLLGIGGFLYWQGKEEPTPPEPPIIEEEPEPSESLIPVDETKITSISAELKLFDLLKQEIELDQPIGAFKRIAVLKNEQEFISLTELFQNLEITIPPYALAELKENHTLVLYNQNERKHLGVMAEIENAENLREQLRFWEQTMVEDLENFFLGETRGEPATPNFQDNVYPPDGEAGKETAIRYINFPEPDLTIDYTIVDNLFILTTSRESIYRIIDKIKL